MTQLAYPNQPYQEVIIERNFNMFGADKVIIDGKELTNVTEITRLSETTLTPEIKKDYVLVNIVMKVDSVTTIETDFDDEEPEPTECQKIVLLSGYTWAEIAERWNTTVKKVKRKAKRSNQQDIDMFNGLPDLTGL